MKFERVCLTGGVTVGQSDGASALSCVFDVVGFVVLEYNAHRRAARIATAGGPREPVQWLQGDYPR